MPDEFERTLIQSLADLNIMRSLAKVIQTTSGDRKIPVISTHGTATWLDEGKPYTESDETFTQVTLSAYKLGTFLKLSEELLNDAAFNVEQYLASEFARRIGAAEEEAFLTGDGNGKPTGVFTQTGGGEAAVTTAKPTDISADELIDLHYSLRASYRARAVWVMNDATVKTVRKLKDGNGQYLWQLALTAGTPDMILGRPFHTSVFAPEVKVGVKTVVFGDLGYYWIADRQGRSFKRLSELFATTGHVETVALLSKLDVDKHISVEIELGEMDLTSAESKATYAQIKEYVWNKFQLKVPTLYIAQIKRKCGIELREHYNKSKKEKQIIPQCTPEKEEVIMDALRHFKMIE